MAYISLGSRVVTAIADQTGLNPGNYSNMFTPAAINVNVPYYEIYHMIVTNVPVGASAQIVVNNKSYGFTYPLTGSEWDPAQPLPLLPQDEVDFLWNIPATGPAPITTVWLRYDSSIAANIRAIGG